MAGDFQLPAPLNIIQRRRQNSPLTPFLEPEGDPLMYRNVAKIASNLNAFQNSLQQLNDRISRCERKAGVVDTSTQTPVVGPFSVYSANVANGAAYFDSGGTGYTLFDVLTLQGGTLAPGGSATQVTVQLVDNNGQALVCIITRNGNYTTPPPSATTVTGGTGSGAMVTVPTQANDGWRVMQMRSGNIAIRSQKDPSSYAGAGLIPPYMSGNFEWVFEIDTDGNIGNQYAETSSQVNAVGGSPQGVGTSVVLNSGASINTPKLIYGLTSLGVSACQQIFFPTPYTNNSAYFYAQVIDDPTGTNILSVNIYGVLASSQSAFEAIVPPGPSIIPLCVVQFNNTTGATPNLTVIQIQSCDLCNRWPSTGSIYGLAQTFRGSWTGDSLSGSSFYPGDVIFDDSGGAASIYVASSSGGSPTEQLNFTAAYIRLSYVASLSDPPSSLASGWDEFFAMLSSPSP